MKTCNKCKNSLPKSAFYSKKGGKDGLCACCKECTLKTNLEWRNQNKEIYEEGRAKFRNANRKKLAEKSMEWYRNNRESALIRFREYHEKNKEYRVARNKEWRNSNKEWFRAYAVSAKGRAKQRNYFARKLHATPSWANNFFIEEIYALAILREKICGGKWHVDHIIPLQGKNVCGLHVHYNLQVIPASENLKKSNRLLSE